MFWGNLQNHVRLLTLFLRISPYSLPIYRQALRPDVPELFPIGHDAASSALWGYMNRVEDPEDKKSTIKVEDKPSKIVLKDLPLHERQNIRLLFGGVGDARHVIATLFDIYEQVQNDKLDWSSVGVHFVLNDIHPGMLARVLMILQSLYKLGSHSWEQIATEDVAGEDALMSYYLYFSCFLLPHQYDKISALAQELLLSPGSPYPWLVCNASTWQGLKPIWSSWKNTRVSARI